MSRMLMTVAVVAAAGMFSVASADAATYCVGAPPGCTGITPSPPKLSRAVELAVDSPEDDVIQLGAVTFTNNDLLDVPQNAGGTLLIEGQGPTTVLAGTTTRPQILDADATLRAVHVAASTTSPGITVMRGTADAISVTGAAAGVTGVRLGEDGRLTSSTVSLTGTGSVAAQTTSGDGRVLDSVLTACSGVLNHAGGTTSVRRTDVLAGTGFDADLGGLLVDTSTLRFGGPCAPDAAVSMRGGATVERTVAVTNLTAVGNEQAGTAGLRLHRESGAAAMTADIRSSVVTGFAATLARTATTGDPPAAVISASAVDEATAVGYTAVEPNLHEPVLGFMDEAAGDFRLTHASELVDRGEPAAPLGSSTTDLAGAAREIEGKPAVNGTIARRDMGAYEYVPGLPTVGGTVTPGTAETGVPLAFDATGDSGDAGEAVAYEWAFHDGTTASGASMSRSFPTAGDYTATVTATDASGWTATDDVTFTVTDPPPDPPDPPDPPRPPDPPDPGRSTGSGTPATTTTVGQSGSSVSRPIVTARSGPASVAFTRRAAAVDGRGRIGIRLLCRATGRPCAGRLALTTVRRVRGRRRTVKLGAVVFTISPGEIATVRVRVNRTRMPLLRGEGQLAARAAATVVDGRPARAELSVQRRPRR